MVSKPLFNQLPMSSNNQELEKSKTHIIMEIIEYIPNSVVIKTIIKKLPVVYRLFLSTPVKRCPKKPHRSIRLFRLLTEKQL